MLRAALAAATRAMRRGGVAPLTRQLVQDVVRLELGRVTGLLTARCRPVQGAGRWRVAGLATRVVGGRRVVTHGELHEPLSTRRAADAAELAAELRADGIGVTHHRTADGDVLQLDVDDRDLASPQVERRCDPVANGRYAEHSGAPLPAVRRYYGFGPQRSVSTLLVLVSDHTEPVPSLPPIDIVVTWVDPTTAAWRQSFRDAGADSADVETHSSRYENHDELRYALRSIWFHCGWFRHVHLVTAGERPAWLRPTDRMSVVEHGSFMPAESLPTFNSHAIESRLHHLPGLADRFVYLNDDFFVGRPTEPSTFFANDLADPIVHPVDGPLPPGHDTQPGQLRATQLTRDLVGAGAASHEIRLLHHAPYANRVSLLDDVEAEFPDVFARTARSRFRAVTDASVPGSLGPWASVAAGRAVVGSVAAEYVSLGHPATRLRLRRIRRDPPLFWCANRTEQSAPGVHARIVDHTLRALYPKAAPWEA